MTTLWLAQHAFEVNDITAANAILAWAQSMMLATSVLPEQFDADDLHFISVAPLTWSQAEFVNCLLDSVSGEAR